MIVNDRQAWHVRQAYGRILLLTLSLLLVWHSSFALTPPALTVGSVSSTAVVLNWTDTTPNVSTYSVQRSLSAGSGFAQIASVAGTIKTYTDSALPTATAFYYLILPVLQSPVSSNVVLVQPPVPPPVGTASVTASPLSIAAGGTETVTVANGPGNPADWVALYLKGAANSAYLAYRYVPAGAKSATLSFTMPTTTGTYEFRFFANNGWTLLATSATVTVGTISSPPPPPPPPPTTGSCPSTSFYVSVGGSDGASGTQSNPWRTIGKAAATLTAGQTACVLDGTYEEGSLRFNTNGTGSAPITIQAQHQGLAILNSTSGCSPGIQLFASYITIDGLRLSVSPNNVACSVYSSANAHVRAWGAIDPNVGSPSSGYQGAVLRNVLADAGVRDVGIKSNQDFTLVEMSTVHGGLETYNTLSTIFRNNTVYDDARASGAIGINAKGGARNFQAYNNIVHVTQSGSGGGIVLGGASNSHFDTASPYEAYNAVAYNNVVLNDGTSAVGLLEFTGCAACTFLNNVGIGGELGMGNWSGGPLTSNPTFKNNILLANGKSPAATSGYYGWDGFFSGTLTVDYTDFFGYSSGVPGQSHAVIGDPLFVNAASDWHLQAGSPALGTGLAVPTVPAYGGGTLDTSKNKDGVIRTAPWNLGVY